MSFRNISRRLLQMVANLRAHERHPLVGTAEIWWVERGELAGTLGYYRDASNAGVGVLCGEPIPCGKSVFIGPVGRMRQAVVRHCRPADTVFHIGFEFMNPAPAKLVWQMDELELAMDVGTTW
ncbi:MAG TPA: hypothetical protein VN442_07950 [Bryobacteraceae bacterium]|nr:hypothetical protein [Bryobacteraceae bacterium]